MEIKERKRLIVNQTRVLKLALDAIMLVLLVLMYEKQVISMSFHEIGGLVLIGMFVIHHLVNARWIGANTKRLFAKDTPGLMRARYIVDALLLVAFLAIAVTGILINKTLFAIRVAGNAKMLHCFASAIAIILMGVHLGLHADYIFGKLFKKGANKIAKIATAVLLAALVAFAGYSLFATQFVSLLAAPLQAAQFSQGEFEPSGDVALDGSPGERPSDLSELPEFAQGSEEPQTDGSLPQQFDGAQPPQDGENGMQPPLGNDGAQPPQGGGNGFSGGIQGQDQVAGQGGSSVALLIAQYVSIIALFGAATAGVVKLTDKATNEKRKAVLAEIDAEIVA